METTVLTSAQEAGETAVASVMSLSTDIFVIVAIVGALFLWGMLRGTDTLVAFVLSLIGSVALYLAFPYEEMLRTSPALPIALFIFLVSILYVVLISVVSVYSFSGGAVAWLKNGLLAIAGGGLLVAISYHVVPIAFLYEWAGALDLLFASPDMLFWWMIVPLPILFFI